MALFRLRSGGEATRTIGPLSPASANAPQQHCTDLGWSQADLAEATGTDPRQISRYETGRITLSVDALARIGQALNLPLDHPTYDDIPPRPLKATTTALEPRLNDIAELPPQDQQAVLDHLDALLPRTHLHNITTKSNSG